MSSGFVSGGTNEQPIERDDAWLAAQKEIEANRARKAAASKPSDGRSLFETLEANKAAKQDAFEEANRLKNQFRALDEDEVEFLDTVLESTRKEEERVRKETQRGLQAFRKQQEEADKKARGGEVVVEQGEGEGEDWVAGVRKRKRGKEKEVLKGVKIRRASTVEELVKKNGAINEEILKKGIDAGKQIEKSEQTAGEAESPAIISKLSPPPLKPGLGLVDYGSDDDDW